MKLFDEGTFIKDTAPDPYSLGSQLRLKSKVQLPSLTATDCSTRRRCVTLSLWDATLWNA